MLKVSGLYIYPIKSLPGIALTEALVTEKGFEHDRRQKNNKILFGQNLVHHGEGIVAVGDQLHTLTLNQDERFLVNEKV